MYGILGGRLPGTFRNETIFEKCSNKTDMLVWETKPKLVLFPKWLPRPNHSARQIRLGILSLYLL